MDLSIVTTLYYSAPFLDDFYARMCAEAEKITSAFEIIFINDGSPDHALEIAIGLHEQDERVKIIDLSRNFGHHKAMMTGLNHCTGKLVFLIDSDLEEEPELLQSFHSKMQLEDADVVFGVQKTRKGNLFERFSGFLYFYVFNLFSDYPIPKNLTTVRLMRKRYVSALIEHQEREVVIAGLWVLTGFKQIPFPITKLDNKRSTYNLRRKISLLINSITSFSSKPLVMVFYLGIFISFLAGVAAVYLLIQRLFFGVFLAGWPSLIVSIWFLSGLIIFCLGIIGIYLSKIFIETKKRPYTIIRRIYAKSPALNPQNRDGTS